LIPQLSRNFQRLAAPHAEISPMADNVEAMPIPNAKNAITMRILVERGPGVLAVDEDGRCADADVAILTVVFGSAVTRTKSKVSRRILIASSIL
jgi:hypothetical protein